MLQLLKSISMRKYFWWAFANPDLSLLRKYFGDELLEVLWIGWLFILSDSSINIFNQQG